MGLFDFIKKKNTADTSRLPRFENYGQSPESFSNFEISANGHAEKPPQTIAAPQNEGFKQEYKAQWQDAPAPPQPAGARQEIADATNQAMRTQHGQSEENPVVAPDDVFSTLLKKNYQESEESLKRQRASEFWGNLAKLFGQTVSSALGARIFSPIQDNTAEYNQAMDRLRNSYNDTLLNYSLADAKAEREAKAQADKMQLQFERDKAMAEINANLKAGLLDKQTAADLKKQAQKAEDARKLQGIRDRAAASRDKMNNAASMEREKFRQREITKRNAKASLEKKRKYPKMQFTSQRYGKGRVYDLNDPGQVAQMYNEGVRNGIYPSVEMLKNKEGAGRIEDMMRDAILGGTGNYKPSKGNRPVGATEWESYEEGGDKNNKWNKYKTN